jgi:predicted transcriptional regulator
MDQAKRKALEEAGFRVGNAADFLGLSEAERRLVELRLKAARLVRQKREALNLSQKQLATRLGSSQSRVAKLESGGLGISMDLIIRAFFETGGNLNDLVEPSHAKKSKFVPQLLTTAKRPAHAGSKSVKRPTARAVK